MGESQDVGWRVILPLPHSAADTLLRRFEQFAGRSGALYFAPGRINLIGEHVDYSGGFVLPAALELGTRVAISPRTDDRIRVYSLNENEAIELNASEILPERTAHWSDYIRGVAWVLSAGGRRLRGADVVISSDVPVGFGLSSSAALEVAFGFALLDVSGEQIPPMDLARACQRAENEVVGVSCGLMDQFAATHGQRNCAMLLDCESFEWRPVPLPTEHCWIIASTMVRHALASGEYNLRRAEASALNSVLQERCPHRQRLRDLESAEVTALCAAISPRLARRLCHLVTENQRVLAAVNALEAADMAALGRLLVASHESLRDDYEVSCQELDVMVDMALGLEGCLGSRMMGGGFGGCSVSLVEKEHAQFFTAEIGRRYGRWKHLKPWVHCCEPGDSVRRIA